MRRMLTLPKGEGEFFANYSIDCINSSARQQFFKRNTQNIVRIFVNHYVIDTIKIVEYPDTRLAIDCKIK